MPTKWTRVDDRTMLGYRSAEGWEIHDNGGGYGPSAGSGRWAIVLDGVWLDNVDTLAAAKRFAEKVARLERLT